MYKQYSTYSLTIKSPQKNINQLRKQTQHDLAKPEVKSIINATAESVTEEYGEVPDSSYMSTTMLAKSVNLNGKQLISHLIDQGVIIRNDSNKLTLTPKGEALGGLYRHKSADEFWIVWPHYFRCSRYVSELIQLNSKQQISRPPISDKYRNKVTYYREYHPWRNGNNPNFDTFSKKIIDLKNDRNDAINFFFNLLTNNADFDNTEAIAYVPSHDPENKHSPVRQLSQKLAAHYGWIDATDCIVRYRKIEKLATGGMRNIDVHLNSLKVVNTSEIANKNMLILDDVTTTGNSLRAAMQLMNQMNVKSTWSYALGATWH